MVVFVRAEVDLCAPVEAGVGERVAERPDFEPPRPLHPEPGGEVARRGELPREGVAERR